jgi:hypothetical protein
MAALSKLNFMLVGCIGPKQNGPRVKINFPAGCPQQPNPKHMAARSKLNFLLVGCIGPKYNGHPVTLNFPAG